MALSNCFLQLYYSYILRIIKYCEVFFVPILIAFELLFFSFNFSCQGMKSGCLFDLQFSAVARAIKAKFVKLFFVCAYWLSQASIKCAGENVKLSPSERIARMRLRTSLVLLYSWVLKRCICLLYSMKYHPLLLLLLLKISIRRYLHWLFVLLDCDVCNV